MDTNQIISELNLSNHAVGLGGCKVQKTTLSCCEYNITIFDGGNQIETKTVGNELIRIHHAKILDSDPDLLQKYDSMEILSDPNWDLRTLLSKINDKNEKLRLSVAKKSIIDAIFFTTRAKQDLDNEFASIWIKCSALLIADALVLLSSYQRSPTHMMEFLRQSAKNKQNDSFTIITEILGLERATPSLLERMVKSTIGFSDMIENNGHGSIIENKYRFLVENSLLSDCYFYLVCINKNIILSIRDTIHKRQELVHILKTALDFDHDRTKLEQQANQLQQKGNELIGLENYG